VAEVFNGRIPDDDFADERRAILASWPAGSEVDLDESFDFHAGLPRAKNFAARMANAYAEGETVAWPRTGQALLNEHIDDLLELWESGAQLHATHCDAYTRTQRYAEATAALEESEAEGRSLLNGVPVVSLGVAQTRRIVTSTPGPNQFRTGTPDARLSAEIVFAAGFRALQGGMLGTSLPFIKDMPIAEAIRNWQYVERLVGLYQEQGIDVHREYYGALMGMIMPPSIMCSSLIFDALMGAEQGVKHMTLGVNNNLHIVQDVATLRVIAKLAPEYLGRHGFGDVAVTPLLHMWMGQFPHGEADSFALIGLGALTAVLGRAAAVIVKTPDEAFGVASTEANAKSVRMARGVITSAARQRYPDSDELTLEMEMIEKETRAIVDTALELGEGAIADGVTRAYATGTMDVPFSPARGNAGKALPVRDANGAVRFLEFGNLPFDLATKNFHSERVHERVARDSNGGAAFRLVVKDVSLETFQGAELAGIS
jgi:methylaspartate mutase epsilon subunit